MGKLADKVRVFFGRGPQERDTMDVLRQRVGEMRDVVGLTQHAGWEPFERMVREVRDRKNAELLALSPAELAGPAGAAKAGEVNGLDAALDVPVLIVEAGAQAEKILQGNDGAKTHGPKVQRLA
jgi:hypothetical protein